MRSGTNAPLHNGQWWQWCGCVVVTVTCCGDCGETVDVDYTRNAHIVLTPVHVHVLLDHYIWHTVTWLVNDRSLNFASHVGFGSHKWASLV